MLLNQNFHTTLRSHVTLVQVSHFAHCNNVEQQPRAFHKYTELLTLSTGIFSTTEHPAVRGRFKYNLKQIYNSFYRFYVESSNINFCEWSKFRPKHFI